jgi:benzoylsuccinyl-CoA thiolase BbsB subunit
MIPFGRYSETWVEELGRKACEAAIQDSGVPRGDIQAAYCSHSFQGRVTGQRILKDLGLTGIPVINVENACAGGGASFHQTWMAIAGGCYNVGLAIGVEKMTKGLIPPNPEDLDGLMGRTYPGRFAMMAQRHMYEYGTTKEQLALVSVKNHRNGSLNPYAHYQESLNLEAVLNSRMIAEPLTLLQCCPVTDGAAAAVLCSKDTAKKYHDQPIEIVASIVTSGLYQSIRKGDSSSETELTKRAGEKAYEMAGIGPEDINIAEVHDCFSIAELLHYEELGFCRFGESGKLIEEGTTCLDGKIPINPSGGLLAKGHPMGATGIGQIVEIVWQLRGQAGKRQVKNPKVGLTHCVGGATPGIGQGACSVHILKK